MKHKISINLSMFAATALLAGAVAVAPLPLRAQSSMHSTPSAAATTPAQVVNQLLGTVEHDFVPLAEAMPADKYDFAPTNGDFKGVRTFASQVKHVAHANFYMFGRASGLKPSHMPDWNNLKTKDQLVAALKQSFVFGHRAINTLTAQNALETIKPVDGINTRAGVMVFAVVHMNDHYGQMVEYLRMNSIIPPASRHSGK